jgi:dephospho-CoA kinase
LLRVGLTGGIASGKTQVRERLAARGCRTLDLDQAARDAVAPGSEALAEIVAAFGERVLKNGVLDRAALGALVFADAEARVRLNAIVHPRVRELERRWAAGQPKGAVLVTDAALLVETGAHLRFDRLVVVHCEPAVQLARLRARDGLDERSAQARIDAQMPAAEKKAFGHFLIDSSGAPEDTSRAADAVFEELRPLAERSSRGAVTPGHLLGGLVHGPRAGPRGLEPEGLLRLAAERGSLELEPLAARLEPKATGPWYDAARQAPPGGPASALAPALVAWALASRGADVDFLASAAASLARLTHVEAAPRAEACLLALLLQDVALHRSFPRDLEERAQGHRGLAARWGGSDPGDTLLPVLEAARAHADDPPAARAAAASRGAEGALAGALVGAAVGASDAALAELLERIRTRAP